MIDATLAQMFLRFAVAVVVFLLPGFAWGTWLHRGDRFGWPLRLVLGFSWSFAVFSLVGGPFLWFGGSFTGFLAVLAPVWACYSLAAIFLWLFRRTTPVLPEKNTAAPDLCAPAAKHADRPQPSGEARRSAQKRAEQHSRDTKADFRLWIALGGFCVLLWGVLYLWAGKDSSTQEQILLASPLLVAGVGLICWRLRGRLGPQLGFTMEDDSPAPRAWRFLALAFIVGQAVSAVIYFRPDWDDCYYLAAVLDYQHAQVLNDRDPGSREPGVVDGPHRAMCLELWGAVLCRLTGTRPLVLFHTLLPGLLILGVYAAYSALLAEIVPRRWVPLALLGLSGYFLWGICGQFSGANHFLVRIWQGKSLVLHLSMPLIAMLLLRCASCCSVAHALSLLACSVCALGFSSSAIFLCGVLILCLGLVLLPLVSGGRLRFLAVAGLALTPLALEGLAIFLERHTAVQAPKVGHAGGEASAGGSASSWTKWFICYRENIVGEGCVDLLWLFSLPLLALLLQERKRLAYLVFLPALLLFTFLSPLLLPLVVGTMTTETTYYRLFWLLPVGPGLGICLALGARLAGQLSPLRWQHLPLAATGIGLLLLAVLPGRYVWSPRNRYDAFMVPEIGQNVEKMPPDLLTIAQHLEHDPDVQQGKILCSEEASSYLTSWSPEFRFVVTRPLYLSSLIDRPDSERYFLVLISKCGPYAPRVREQEIMQELGSTIPATKVHKLLQSTLFPQLSELPKLLSDYQVVYIITLPPRGLIEAELPGKEDVIKQFQASRAALLRSQQFEQVYTGVEYALWKRKTQGRGRLQRY